MSIRIYPVEGGWVVADDAGWLPGVYETPEAAEKAAMDAWEEKP